MVEKNEIINQIIQQEYQPKEVSEKTLQAKDQKTAELERKIRELELEQSQQLFAQTEISPK